MQLKGQSYILKILGIDKQLEESGIRVYVDDQRETVHTKAFAEVCDMLNEQKRCANAVARAYDRRISSIKKRGIILAIISAVVLVYLVYPIAYDKGHEKGHEEGKDSGYKAGYTSGHYAGYREVADEYEYFRDAAVIITTSGTKYHRFGCSHIANREVYILNIEAAVDIGYSECLDCKKELSYEDWSRLKRIEDSSWGSPFGSPFKDGFVETHKN